MTPCEPEDLVKILYIVFMQKKTNNLYVLPWYSARFINYLNDEILDLTKKKM